MKTRFSIARIACFLSLMLLCLLSFSAFAKEVNLYDQPNANAKVVGKVDLAIGIVPIYTPQNGDWMKVGDPRNGNTGWIKSSDLKGANGEPTSVTFSQQIINNGNGVPHTYQLLQYGQPHQLNDAQSKKLMQEMQQHQQAIQQSIQEMARQFNMMQDEWPVMMNGQHMPLIMPIVFVPVKQQPTQAQQPAKLAPAQGNKPAQPAS